MITDVYLGVPVDDFETACAWYEIFFGREADTRPKAGEAVWGVAGTSSVLVIADDARAGSALLTLHVDDLAQHVGFLAMRGIAPDAIETVPGVVRTAAISDPAGNAITISESLA